MSASKVSAERDRLRSGLNESRLEAQRDRDQAHELELRCRSQHTEQETTSQNLERMRGQQVHLQQRRDELQRALTDSDAPLQSMQEELAVQLQKRVEVETELRDERRGVEAIEHKLREDEQQRHRKEDDTGEIARPGGSGEACLAGNQGAR